MLIEITPWRTTLILKKIRNEEFRKEEFIINMRTKEFNFI